MTLRDISVAFVMVQIIVLFGGLYESRYARRTTFWLYIVCLAVLGTLNVGGLLVLGDERMAQLLLLTCTLPSFLFFLFTAKYRDGRFFFTFCAVDVLALWIMGITALLPLLTERYGGLLMLVSRVLLFLLLDVYVFGNFRRDYLKAQAVIRKGWGIFSLVAAMFYVTIVVMNGFPTLLRNRPAYIPAFLLFMACVPLVLYSFVYTMLRQYERYAAEHTAKLVSMQISAMSRQLKTLQESQQESRVMRHDLRHHIRQMSVLLQRGDLESAIVYMGKYTETLDKASVRRYCKNPYLDAMFCYYLTQAEKQGIRVSSRIEVPGELALNDLNLAIVIANLLENAIIALEKLPAEAERMLYVSLRQINGQLLLEVKNPYTGELQLDENGLPLTSVEGHGMGRLSLLDFAQKNNALIDCQTAGGVFQLRLLIPPQKEPARDAAPANC